jgi:hypothetical protein
MFKTSGWPQYEELTPCIVNAGWVAEHSLATYRRSVACLYARLDRVSPARRVVFGPILATDRSLLPGIVLSVLPVRIRASPRTTDLVAAGFAATWRGIAPLFKWTGDVQSYVG